MSLSTEYQNQLRTLHQRPGWGTTGHRYAYEILSWARLWECRDILDYGCGKGTLGKALGAEGADVREYDPGIPGKDAEPSPADCVVSTDVLEHVEPDQIDATLAQLARLTKRAGWHLIAQYPASSKDQLPDGRNAHLSLLSTEEWLARFKRAFPDADVQIRDYVRPNREGRARKPACIVTIQRK